jgi:hypothetical protein
MCPLCVGTAALIASGSSSAGGLAAVLLRHLARQRRDERRSPGAQRRDAPARPGASAPAGGQPPGFNPRYE